MAWYHDESAHLKEAHLFLFQQHLHSTCAAWHKKDAMSMSNLQTCNDQATLWRFWTACTKLRFRSHHRQEGHNRWPDHLFQSRKDAKDEDKYPPVYASAMATPGTVAGHSQGIKVQLLLLFLSRHAFITVLPTSNSFSPNSMNACKNPSST
jgi:hypothetical protein